MGHNLTWPPKTKSNLHWYDLVHNFLYKIFKHKLAACLVCLRLLVPTAAALLGVGIAGHM